jgi:hypothetical protein
MMLFEDALLAVVARRLQSLGYAYDARPRDAAELLGFRKALGEDGQAVVQFQLRNSPPESFTVNLLRVNADARGARLSTVLWYVMGLREYPVSDYWWPANEVALQDAADKVAQYGVPWLEDAQAPRPWEMPAHNGYEFVQAVEMNLAPTLQRRGYRLALPHLSGEVPYPYFVNDWPDGTHSFIELQSVYSLDPREFQFDVRLQRCAEENPLTVMAQSGVSLAQLAWQARGTGVAAAPPSAMLRGQAVAEAKTLLWRYADRAELDEQLRDALSQIERIGRPWIDQAID